MRDKRVSSLLVMDTSNSPVYPLGILTERDFVRRVCAVALNSKNVSVKQIRSYPLVTVDPISSIDVAANVMLANKVRHLLVVGSMRNPVGMLTPSDFTRYLSNLVD